MKTIIHNSRQFDTVIADMKYEFEAKGSLAVDYHPPYKVRTKKQVGFIFGALIGSMVDFLRECGVNTTHDAVRYDLYEEIRDIAPELVIDSSILGRRAARVKHLSEMDRRESSIFIEAIFHVIDNNIFFKAMQLAPDIRHNWINHLTLDDIRADATVDLPVRDDTYLSDIRKECCIVCGRREPIEAHHLKIPGGGLSLKSPDWMSLPLCAGYPDGGCHHALAHGEGNTSLEASLQWVIREVPLVTFCRLKYLRWRNKGSLNYA